MARKTSGSGSTRRGIAFNSLGNLTAPLSSLITAPLIAQGLGVVGRGELAAATAPLLLAAAGLTFGIPESITYFVARKAASHRSVLRFGLLVSLAIGLIGSIGIVLLAPLLSGGSEYIRELITIVGFTLAPSMLGTSLRGYIRGLQLWRLLAFDQVTASAFRLVAIAALVSTHELTPLTAGLVTGGANFVGAIVYLFVPKVLARERTAVNRDARGAESAGQLVGPQLRRSMSGYGLGVWLGAAAGILLSRIDQVLMLPLSSAAALGLYAVAASIADVGGVFNSAVRDVVFSVQSARQDDRALALASRLSTILTAAAAVGLCVLAWMLVPPFFGEAFSASVPLIAILMLGTVLGNPGSVLAAGLSARGRPILRSLAILMGVAVDVVAIFLLVPILGAMGAAIATAVADVATGAFVVYLAHRAFGLSPRLFIRFRVSDFKYLWQLLADRFRRRRGA